MLAGVADCRRSRKWAAKEDGNWDLNLGPAAIGKKRDHVALKGERPCGSEGKERPCGSEVKERDHAASKSREDHKVMGEKEETMQL